MDESSKVEKMPFIALLPPPPPDGLRSRKSSDEPAQRLSFEEEEPTSPIVKQSMPG